MCVTVPSLPSSLRTVILSILLLALLAFAAAQERPSYTISVVPQTSRLVLFENWLPLLDRLGAEVGAEFELIIADTIPDFERDFLAGTPDFAFMNPYHVVMAFGSQGYVPLVSDGSRQLSGILVVPVDSPVQSVRDLEGREVAFPAPNAFGASLYMRALLAEREGVDIIPVYVETHANAYRHALLGDATAGGGVMNTLRMESESLQRRLRVLYRTPDVTPHPLAAHPRVPEAVRESVVEALLALAASEEGRALLRAVQLAEPGPVDYERDYSMLADLGLDRYVVMSE